MYKILDVDIIIIVELLIVLVNRSGIKEILT